MRETLALSQAGAEELGQMAQWLLKKVVRPAQSICVSSATMKKLAQLGKQPLKSKEWRGVVEK